MLFARSGRRQSRIAKRLKTQCLAGSQVVVCKIHQPAFFVPQALFPAIPFRLLGVGLPIFPPIVGVRPAPLPRTLQADLLIDRIGGDLLPMIIRAALALACSLAANPLLRMISGRPKNLLTVGAAAILHQAAPKENGRGSFSLEVLLNLSAPAQKLIKTYRVSTPWLPMGPLLLAAIDTGSIDVFGSRSAS